MRLIDKVCEVIRIDAEINTIRFKIEECEDQIQKLERFDNCNYLQLDMSNTKVYVNSEMYKKFKTILIDDYDNKIEEYKKEILIYKEELMTLIK